MPGSHTQQCPDVVIVMKEALVWQHPWLLPGWCSAQQIQNPMIAGGNHTLIPSCRQSALRNRLVTEEECGRKSEGSYNVKTC